MKQMSLAARLAKKSIFSYILLSVLTILAVYHVLVYTGMMEYVYYGGDEVKKYLYNADYIMDRGDAFSVVSLENKMNKIKSFDGVKNVIYRLSGSLYLSTDKNGRGEANQYDVYIYSRGYGECYKEKLASGSWGNVLKKSKDGEYRFVTNIDGIDVGDELYAFLSDPGDEGGAEAVGKVRAAGKLYTNQKILSTGTGSNQVDLTNCYEYHKDVIIMPYDEELLDKLRNYSYSFAPSYYYYIIYEDGISGKQKEYVRKNAMGTSAGYEDMSKALERTMEKTKKEQDFIFHGNLLIPVLTIYLSAMTFIVVSVISAYRHMKEFSVYYMVGCTKRKIVGIINLSVLPVLAPAVIFGFFLVNNYGRFARFRVGEFITDDVHGYVMYNSLMVNVIIFLLALMLISNVIILLVISRMSPTRMYRQLNG